jgi:hypothetical protein
MAYDDLFNNVPAALNAPQSIQTTQTANVTQATKVPWSLAFDQNVPLVSNLGKQGPGTPTVGVLSFQGIDPHFRSAFAYTYHLGVQHALGTAVSLEVDYQGSNGHALGMYIDVNQPTVIVRDPSRRGPVAPNEQVFPYRQFNQAQIARPVGGSNYNGIVPPVNTIGAGQCCFAPRILWGNHGTTTLHTSDRGICPARPARRSIPPTCGWNTDHLPSMSGSGSSRYGS